MLLSISGQDNVVIKKISYPIMKSGPTTCEFTTYNEDIALGTYIVVKESLTTRFQGYVTRKSRERTKEKSGKVRDYTAVCKSYYEYSQQNVNISEYGDTEEDFSGNGVEYQSWLYRENATQHVTWPPTGDDPVVFDDQSDTVALPGDVISIGEVEENNLPSHIKIEVKKYREKRFPVVADFDYTKIPTQEMLKKNPKYALYGRQYKIMDPDDPTQEYTTRPLFNAAVGGSKFYVKGHASLKFPESEDFAYSASINPKKTKVCFTKQSGGDPPTTTKKNFCQVQMVFHFGFELPRVKGAHGTATDQQECYVRVRVLEAIQVYYETLGGINSQDRLPSINHVEIEVSNDTFDGSHYRDWTYGGPAGALHETDDLGNGVWTSDLSGTYTTEEGVERGQSQLDKALEHYQIIKYTTDVVFAGINWDLNRKVSVDGKAICLDSIDWSFGLLPQENRTHYNGVRLLYGFSHLLAAKKKWVQKQEEQRTAKRERTTSPDHKESAEGVQHPVLHAKICWNVDSAGDLSEGEFVEKNAAGEWISQQNVIWISWVDSWGVVCKTAGDMTIFQVEKIKSDVTRNSTTRDLYRATACIYEGGSRISHLYTTQKDAALSKVTGYLLSRQYCSVNPWTDIYQNGENSSAWIFTAIWNGEQSVAKKNQCEGFINCDYDEWDLSGAENYLYLEKVDVSKFPPYWQPINPRLVDGKQYESDYENSGISIATYRLK